MWLSYQSRYSVFLLSYSFNLFFSNTRSSIHNLIPLTFIRSPNVSSKITYSYSSKKYATTKREASSWEYYNAWIETTSFLTEGTDHFMIYPFHLMPRNHYIVLYSDYVFIGSSIWWFIHCVQSDITLVSITRILYFSGVCTLIIIRTWVWASGLVSTGDDHTSATVVSIDPAFCSRC